MIVEALFVVRTDSRHEPGSVISLARSVGEDLGDGLDSNWGIVERKIHGFAVVDVPDDFVAGFRSMRHKFDLDAVFSPEMIADWRTLDYPTISRAEAGTRFVTEDDIGLNSGYGEDD